VTPCSEKRSPANGAFTLSGVGASIARACMD
jgi:hypothetical protein